MHNILTTNCKWRYFQLPTLLSRSKNDQCTMPTDASVKVPVKSWSRSQKRCQSGRTTTKAVNMSSPAEEVSHNKHFEGFNRRYKHQSSVLGCSMNFTIYFPPQAESQQVPVMYFLSGLTCTDENFVQKSGAQRRASELGIALVMPDTSPRGLNIPGENDSWDFGVGAGFYINATVEKWKNWRMYDYVLQELPDLLRKQFGSQLDLDNAAIFGHSMGGHGALVLGLRNPQKFKSISAFSPICNPVNVPWGVKAFTGYLGEDKEAWKQYDATELLKAYTGPQLPILVDQGTVDNFLKDPNQLQPDALHAVAKEQNYPLTMRYQSGYDHSYFFISTFVADHIDFHSKQLLKC